MLTSRRLGDVNLGYEHDNDVVKGRKIGQLKLELQNELDNIILAPPKEFREE